jgi:hypothetical protein
VTGHADDAADRGGMQQQTQDKMAIFREWVVAHIQATAAANPEQAQNSSEDTGFITQADLLPTYGNASLISTRKCPPS